MTKNDRQLMITIDLIRYVIDITLIG